MAKVCDICGRGSLKIKSRSYSNVATIRRQQLNLQTKIINGQKVKICARCLKTLIKTQ